jgi:hypothetical protein
MDLSMKVLDTMLSKLCSDLITDDLINPPPSCLPIIIFLAVRSKLLKEMPTLDNMDVVVWQVGDASRGVQIPRMHDADGKRGVGSTLGSDKGKEKMAMSGSAPNAGSWSPPKDTRASTELAASLEKKRRLVHSNRSSISELTSEREQAPR